MIWTENWGPYLLTYIHMIHDSRPEQSFKACAQSFDMKTRTVERTTAQWRMFSLQIVATWSRAVSTQMIGGGGVPKVTVDESYQKKVPVEENMARRSPPDSVPVGFGWGVKFSETMETKNNNAESHCQRAVHTLVELSCV